MFIFDADSPCYKSGLTSQNVKGIQGSPQVQSASSKQQWSLYI